MRTLFAAPAAAFALCASLFLPAGAATLDVPTPYVPSTPANVDEKPDRHVQISKSFYLFVVPASVAGKWQLAASLPAGAREYELELTQRFQEVKGGARVPGGYLPAFEARMSGERIAFVLLDEHTSYRFEGRVSASSMEGIVRWGLGPKQQESAWRATRMTAVTEG